MWLVWSGHTRQSGSESVIALRWNYHLLTTQKVRETGINYGFHLELTDCQCALYGTKDKWFIRFSRPGKQEKCHCDHSLSDAIFAALAWNRSQVFFSVAVALQTWVEFINFWPRSYSDSLRADASNCTPLSSSSQGPCPQPWLPGLWLVWKEQDNNPREQSSVGDEFPCVTSVVTLWAGCLLGTGS